MLGAIRAAEKFPVRLDTVTNYATTTMRAGRRQSLDRAFEAVERLGRSILGYPHRRRNHFRKHRRTPFFSLVQIS